MVQKHDPEVELAETFAQVARSLLAEPDVNRTLDTICKLAVENRRGMRSRRCLADQPPQDLALDRHRRATQQTG